MKDALTVALGGVVGSLARAAGYFSFPPGDSGIPWVTAGTNVFGALLLGILATALVPSTPGTERLRLFLATGVLGSFTTFSALAIDAAAMLQIGRMDQMGAYLLVTVPGGLLAAGVGIVIGRGLRGAG